MTAQRRGFGRERHSWLKGAIAVIAVAGFGGGWWGLAEANVPADLPVEIPATVPSTTPTTPTPATRVPTTPTPFAGLPPAATESASTASPATTEPPEPKATAARTHKRSRGS